MAPPRTILIVGGGLEAVPGIERVKRLGVRVVVSDGSFSAPGLRPADDRIVVSTYDVPGTVEPEPWVKAGAMIFGNQHHPGPELL